MKINILFPNFAHRPSGGHRIAYQYANGLAEKGHFVTLIKSSGLSDSIKNKFIFFAMFFITHFTKKWFVFNKSIKKKYVFSLCEKNIPDADVTIATAYSTAEILEKCSKSKGKKIYLIQHYETWLAPKNIVDKTWKYDDMVKIIISMWLWNVGEKLNAKNMVYIPNFIDEKLFTNKNDFSNRKYDVSMMYSTNEIKGAQYGLSALELVKNIDSNFSAVLFGSCKRDAKIPQWIDYIENPSQEFLANSIYNYSKIYLCPSISEGWGLPPMEAMACGAAVVTTKNGGVEDFCIDKETSLICEVKNAEQMAEKIILLLSHNNIRKKLILNSLEKIKEFSFKKAIDKLSNVLN